MTNAEKLAKDTDYLADIISEYPSDCDACPAKEECSKWDVESCYDFIKWWLESEAEGSEELHEVKHGKWIKDHGWYSHHCSCCGRSTSTYVDEDGDWYDRVFDFCPNCGARMDGDEK